MGKECKKRGSTGDYLNVEEKTETAHTARFRALVLMA